MVSDSFRRVWHRIWSLVDKHTHLFMMKYIESRISGTYTVEVERAKIFCIMTYTGLICRINQRKYSILALQNVVNTEYYFCRLNREPILLTTLLYERINRLVLGTVWGETVSNRIFTIKL
jgi:hypothetical protein